MGSPRYNQLGSLRRDGKEFVDKRRRKKREKERKEKGRRKLFSSIVSDLGGSRTDPTHYKR